MLRVVDFSLRRRFGSSKGITGAAAGWLVEHCIHTKRQRYTPLVASGVGCFPFSCSVRFPNGTGSAGWLAGCEQVCARACS